MNILQMFLNCNLNVNEPASRRMFHRNRERPRSLHGTGRSWFAVILTILQYFPLDEPHFLGRLLIEKGEYLLS